MNSFRLGYSVSDKQRIVNYIISKKAHDRVKSDSLYKEMVEDNVLIPQRTARSIRHQFANHIINNIAKFCDAKQSEIFLRNWNRVKKRKKQSSKLQQAFSAAGEEDEYSDLELVEPGQERNIDLNSWVIRTPRIQQDQREKSQPARNEPIPGPSRQVGHRSQPTRDEPIPGSSRQIEHRSQPTRDEPIPGPSRQVGHRSQPTRDEPISGPSRQVGHRSQPTRDEPIAGPSRQRSGPVRDEPQPEPSHHMTRSQPARIQQSTSQQSTRQKEPHLISPSQPKPVPLTPHIRTVPMKLVHRSRKQDDDDEDSDDDSEWLSTQRTKPLSIPVIEPNVERYSQFEDKALVEFLARMIKIQPLNLQRDRDWTSFEIYRPVPARSWKSLRSRYEELRRASNLDRLQIPNNTLQQLGLPFSKTFSRHISTSQSKNKWSMPQQPSLSIHQQPAASYHVSQDEALAELLAEDHGPDLLQQRYSSTRPIENNGLPRVVADKQPSSAKPPRVASPVYLGSLPHDMILSPPKTTQSRRENAVTQTIQDQAPPPAERTQQTKEQYTTNGSTLKPQKTQREIAIAQSSTLRSQQVIRAQNPRVAPGNTLVPQDTRHINESFVELMTRNRESLDRTPEKQRINLKTFQKAQGAHSVFSLNTLEDESNFRQGQKSPINGSPPQLEMSATRPQTRSQTRGSIGQDGPSTPPELPRRSPSLFSDFSDVTDFRSCLYRYTPAIEKLAAELCKELEQVDAAFSSSSEEIQREDMPQKEDETNAEILPTENQIPMSSKSLSDDKIVEIEIGIQQESVKKNETASVESMDDPLAASHRIEETESSDNESDTTEEDGEDSEATLIFTENHPFLSPQSESIRSESSATVMSQEIDQPPTKTNVRDIAVVKLCESTSPESITTQEEHAHNRNRKVISESSDSDTESLIIENSISDKSKEVPTNILDKPKEIITETITSTREETIVTNEVENDKNITITCSNTEFMRNKKIAPSNHSDTHKTIPQDNKTSPITYHTTNVQQQVPSAIPQSSTTNYIPIPTGSSPQIAFMVPSNQGPSNIQPPILPTNLMASLPIEGSSVVYVLPVQQQPVPCTSSSPNKRSCEHCHNHSLLVKKRKIYKHKSFRKRAKSNMKATSRWVVTDVDTNDEAGEESSTNSTSSSSTSHKKPAKIGYPGIQSELQRLGSKGGFILGK